MLKQKRKNLQDQIRTARDSLNDREGKYEQLQPQVFKLASQLRSDYKSLLAILRQMSANILDGENAEQIDWNRYELDLMSDEFVHEKHKTVFELIGKLKSGVEQAMEETRHQTGKIVLETEEKERERGLLVNEQAKNEMEYNLKLEHLKRALEDQARLAQEAKVQLDVAQAKHKSVKDDLADQNAKISELQKKKAELDKLFIAEKTVLEKLGNDILSAALDKAGELYDKFHKLREYKVELMNLGNNILEANLATLEELRARKEKQIEAIKSRKGIRTDVKADGKENTVPM